MTDESALTNRRVAPDTPAQLQARMQASNMLHLTGQVSALRQEVAELRAEAQRRANAEAPTREDPAAVTMHRSSKHDTVLRDLAGQLDAHVTFGNGLKARVNWIIDLWKATHAWIRDDLQPFNRTVDNRLRFLEMVVEEAVLAASPEALAKLDRIRQIIGTADLAQRETPPSVPKDPASS